MPQAVKMEEITQQSKIFAIRLKGWREKGKKRFGSLECKVWEVGSLDLILPPPPSLDFEAAAPNFL